LDIELQRTGELSASSAGSDVERSAAETADLGRLARIYLREPLVCAGFHAVAFRVSPDAV
jgi:hypothetical protein